MIEDFRSLDPATTEIAADVCIIGCGPVGVALAEELEGAGRRVVVVEGGGLEIDPSLQDLNEADVAGLPHTGHLDGRGRGVGGTGRLWAGQCLRLDPIDFVERAWVPHSGWPLDAGTLDPYYRRAERFFRVDARSYGEDSYVLSGIEPPRWAQDTLLNHFTVYTPEVDTARHHLAALRAARHVRVLTHAHVTEVEADEACAVRGVAIRTMEGRQARVAAPAVVLCAGGIENARLLLGSRTRVAAGLGNAAGLVGRFFQEHPNAMTATLRDGDATALQERFRMLYRGKGRFFPKFALSPVLQERHGVLNCNAHLLFEHPADSGLAALRALVLAARQRRVPEQPLALLAAVVRDAGTVGAAAARRLSGRSPVAQPSAIRLQCYLEQAPSPDSRVRLTEGVDRLGMPRLCVDWRLGELERRTLVAMTGTVGRELDRLGLGTLDPEAWMEGPGDDWALALRDCSHHMGTTRMASRPDEGVVDPDCQVFGVPGLYAAGSSVFPTSGYANPTLTAVALAMRLADHLGRRAA